MIVIFSAPFAALTIQGLTKPTKLVTDSTGLVEVVVPTNSRNLSNMIYKGRDKACGQIVECLATYQIIAEYLLLL